VANEIGGHTRTSKGKRGRGMNFDLLADVLRREAEDPDGLNIAQMIVDALKSDKLDAKTKLLAQLELLQYMQPKLKAVEHKGKVELDPETLDARLQYLLTKAGDPNSGSGPGQADAGGKAGAARAVEPQREDEEA